MYFGAGREQRSRRTAGAYGYDYLHSMGVTESNKQQMLWRKKLLGASTEILLSFLFYFFFIFKTRIM